MNKVLIIEDDPMVALINKRFLEQMGDIEVLGPVIYEEEMIEIIKNEEVDLIILDVFLPKKNGIDILRSLRSKKILTDVIMVTAANSVEEIKKALAYGIIDYLVKPFEYKRFEEAYRKFENKKKMLLKNKTVVQQDLDEILFNNKGIDIEEIDLPKGLNRRTLDKILEFLELNSNKVWTLREIAFEIKISNVTIKKYMDYLESIGKVEVEVSSGNVGRPELKYNIKI